MTKNNRLYIDIHAIQTLPPSNINRDDTGSPKTAQYGGVRRARVSSQSWKKAMREYFNENGGTSNVGKRSLDIVTYLAEKIQKLDSSMDKEEALTLADDTLNNANVKTKDRRARALFFLGDQQANDLAQAAVEGKEDKKELQAILKDNPAIDIALFGRMVADDPSLNEDASSQVAHAISTHAVETEFDFYTAVDDLAPEDNAGAGMLGVVEFNSSTLYRYANIAIHELLKQIGDAKATKETVKLFVDAFIKSLPTGKINTFANQTLPQALLITLRKDRPVNLVHAFEKPVKSSNGYVEDSIKAMIEEAKNVQKMVEQPLANLYLTTTTVHLEDETSESGSLTALMESLEKELSTNLAEMSD